ncbi:MAG: hypothetical protein KF900_13345 [Bacteroidetes bacterium]|nr:hypothetical protein [Bacteroidota bacterium]
MLKIKTKIALSILVFASFFTAVQAQKKYRYEYGGGVGFSNYLGDIGGYSKAGRGFVLDLRPDATRWNTMGYVRYKFHDRFAVKGAVNYMRIAGNDWNSKNPGRHYRNVRFRNDMFDIQTNLQFLFMNSNKPVGIFSKFTNLFIAGYGFAGIGAYYSNPKGYYEPTDEWVSLRHLRTEGQREKYSMFGVCVPMGVGFTFTISKRLQAHRFGIELNWRWTPSDYLDDVSGGAKNSIGENQDPTKNTGGYKGWVNPDLLIGGANGQAAYFNNPSTHLPAGETIESSGLSGNYGWQGYQNGKVVNQAPRGNPNRDSYFTLTVTYGVAYRANYTKSRGKKIRSIRL